MKYNLMFLGLSLIILGGCRSSYITGSWTSSQPVSQPYKKVMVLGLVRDDDSTLREKMEMHMVDDLAKQGMQAISACRAYGPRAFDNMVEGEAIDKIRESGVDAVITIVLLNKDKEKRIFAGNPRFWPTDYYDTKFWQYYKGMTRSIYEKDYYTISTRYLWESNFYDLNSQAMIYTAQTQSFDPINTESLAHEYGQVIIRNMVKKKVIQKQKQPDTRAF